MKKDNDWLLFGAIALGPFMVGIDFLVIGVAINQIAKYFHTDISTLQWFLSAYAIGNSSFLIIAGKLIDYYGVRKIFFLGLIVFLLSSCLVGCSTNVWLAILGRLFQGASGGVLSTAPVVVLIQAYNTDERTIWISKLIGVAGFGMMLGPIVGGSLITYFNWRAAFLINIPFCLITLFLTFFVLKNDTSQVKTDETFDFLGVIMLILMMVSLTISISHLQDWKLLSKESMATHFVFLLSLLVLIFYEKNIKHPIIDFSLFKYKNVLSGGLLAFITYFIVIAWIFLWGVYLQRVIGLSAILSGIYLLPFGIMMVIGCAFISKISVYLSAKKIGIMGSIFSLVGLLGLAFQKPLINYYTLAIFFGLVGFGFALSNSSSMPLSLNFVPAKKMGIGSGKTMMFRWLGAAIGSSVCSILFVMSSFNHVKKITNNINFHPHLNNFSDSLYEIISGRMKIDYLQQNLNPLQYADVKNLLNTSYLHGLSFCMFFLSMLCVVSILISILKVKE